MAGVYQGLTIKITADDGDLQRALDRNSTQAKRLQRELKEVERNLKFDSRSPEMLRQKMLKVGEQVKQTEDRLKLLKQAESEIGKEKMRSDQWTELQGDIAACEARLRAYNAELRELVATQAANESALGKMGNFFSDNAATFEKVGSGMQKVGGLLTRTVTPAIVGGAAASVKAAVDIDTALTGVRKTVPGTEEDFQRLKDAAIEFSKVNATSATDFLDAQAMGAQLGFAIDELQKFAEVATGLDIATNMDLETAGSEMARFANITKMSHEDIENYASAIVNVGNNMATTESEVSGMAMRLAAAGTQVGMSQADILGLAGALSSLGVEAEAGGTAVSTIMANIDKAVASGDESLETWAATAGKSAEKFASDWKNNPVDALAAVLSGMEKATAEGGNMSLMLEELGISSIRQTDIMKRMAGNSELMAEGVKIANEGWNENVALSEEVANRNDSLAAKFEMLKNRIVAVAEQVGAPIADALLDVVDAAEPLFEAIESGARAFSDMSKEEQLAVLQTAGFLAVLGPMSTGLGRVISSLGPMGEGMTKLAQGFAKVDMIGLASNATKAADGASKAGSAIGAAGTAARTASVGMGALTTAAALLAVAGLALAAKQAKDYFDHMKLVEQATGGVRDAMQGSFGGSMFGGAAEGADTYSKSLNDLKDQHEKVLEANARLAQSISETYAEMGDKNSVIDNFNDALETLESTTEPTERQLADAKIAIDQMNEAFGESFELAQNADGSYSIITKDAAEAARQIDELRGGLGENAQLTEDELAALQEQVQRVNDEFGTTYEVSGSAEEGYQIVGSAADGAREKVDALVASLKAQNNYEAFSGLAKESQSALQAASSNLVAIQSEYVNAEQAVNDIKKALEENPGDLALIENLDDANDKLGDLAGMLTEAQAAYDTAAAASEAFFSAQNLMQQAMDANSSALTRAVADNDLLVNSFVGAGKDVASFKDSLEAAGASAEGLSKIGSKEAAQLAKAYDGSFSSIESLLATFGVEVDEQGAAAAKAADENAASAAKVAEAWRAAFDSENVNWDAVTASVGTTVDQLAAEMEKAGVSVDDFATVGAEGFARLYQAADGDLAAVVASVQHLDSTGISPKEFEVTDNGTIVTKEGEVIDLDSMTIAGKPFYVTDNGSIGKIEGEVANLDAMDVSDDDFQINDNGTISVYTDELLKFDGLKVGDKTYKVENGGTVAKEKDEVNGLKNTIESVPKSKSTHFSTSGKWSFVSDVEAMKSALNGLQNRTVHITTVRHTQNAGGSEPGNASGGVIPRHMAGGIFTQATLTNVGWVGEAGAEAWLEGPGGSSAIVPLTNRRYVRPFAQAVAAEMGASGRNVNVNINVTANMQRGMDENAFARTLGEQLASRIRMEG